jgi:acyl CoA:acetate/3-ketoacid CoA transferase
VQTRCQHGAHIQLPPVFKETGEPKGLTLMHSSAIGDWKERGTTVAPFEMKAAASAAVTAFDISVLPGYHSLI